MGKNKKEPLKFDEQLDFETAIKRLEEVVESLESGELKLEEALELFEEGIRLSRFCNQKLTEAEGKIEILLGEGKKEPFSIPGEENES